MCPGPVPTGVREILSLLFLREIQAERDIISLMVVISPVASTGKKKP
jgi:hypothetical protein